jgi:hypothetical protein
MKILEKLYLFLLGKNVEKRGFGHLVSAYGKVNMKIEVNRKDGKKEILTL